MKTAYALRDRKDHEDQPYDTSLLMPGWVETIIKLVEGGPVDDGDFPSKAARNSLIQYGYAQYVILNGDQAGCVATYKGGYLYCQLLDQGCRVKEAIAFHKAHPDFIHELWKKQNEAQTATTAS